MAFATNGGVRIHYETVGEGQPLLLHHGFLLSRASWVASGYVDALKDQRKLILIDARGHGKSDKPHDPSAYDRSFQASDVVAVLDQLGHQKVDFLGYSMGGQTAYALAKYSPERVRSFIIGGAHPYAASQQMWRDRLAAGKEALMAYFGSAITPGLRERLLANDLAALSAVVAEDRQSIADEALPSMTMPCLLFVGELDPFLAQMREFAARLPNATFFSLPGCDHVTAQAQAIPRIKAFLDQVARA
jgi:pimeloyl-ACP methyl ester carboxylesterase